MYIPMFLQQHPVVVNNALDTISRARIGRLYEFATSEDQVFNKMAITFRAMDDLSNKYAFDVIYVISPDQFTVEKIPGLVTQHSSHTIEKYKSILFSRNVIDGNKLFDNRSLYEDGVQYESIGSSDR